MGYVMDGDALKAAGELNDQLDTLKATGTGLSNRLGGKLVPFVMKLAQGLTAALAPGGKLDKILGGLGDFIGDIAVGMGPLFNTLGDFLPKIIDFAKGLWGAIQPIVKPILGLIEPIFKIFENLMPIITGFVQTISAVLGPIVELIKWVLEGIATIGTAQPGQGAHGSLASDTFGASAAAWGGARGPRVPMSPATSSTSSTSSSTVDINVNAAPGASAAVKQTGKAPGVTLNTGSVRGGTRFGGVAAPTGAH
jgi:hypothetical protein